MRLQTNPLVGIQTPPDGFTDEEKAIAKLAAEHTIQSIYAKLPTSRMKAIVALHFELGYDQTLLAEMFQVTQGQIGYEIEMVQRILANRPHRSKTGRAYRARTPRSEMSLPTLIQLCFALAQP